MNFWCQATGWRILIQCDGRFENHCDHLHFANYRLGKSFLVLTQRVSGSGSTLLCAGANLISSREAL
jgi:hypothetical protein